ncbi:hypothetical protein CAPTEDRAFT_209419 [Capitella teleta]|uniref:Uncharacterized protein n=1 Tax=Capitella teleta TaxID=283909 RepID=R7UXX3_CAPTE|nr:hypothetical protein CAPTEDRAFT_209419 [Capitella teleta]|eukprot:ELU11122.1 hypothetical protein CAPTEDRAFT_209419 [Capitella teleta]
MEDEILLFEGDEKSPKYICNFIKVCSESDHRIIIREPLFSKRDADGARNKLDALEKNVLQIGQRATIATKSVQSQQQETTFIQQNKDPRNRKQASRNTTRR